MRSHLATGLATLGLVGAPAAMKVADAFTHTASATEAVSHAGHRTPVRSVESGGSGGGLDVACKLPFDGIKEEHPIDESCGAGGKTSSDAQIAQNTAKNNFCAPGPGAVLSFKDFDALQDAAESAGVTFGSASAVPDDRSALQHLLSVGSHKIGEGVVVRLGAYVLDAHYSNVKAGESVNCKIGGEEYNDIHIVLVDDPKQDDACMSVTAEMSPHFRPEIWTPDTVGHVRRKMRFTGQLFFDASHKPCDNSSGTRESPARRSLFEIHPVYAVDVCKTGNGTACDPAKDTGWVPLDQWSGDETETAEEGE